MKKKMAKREENEKQRKKKLEYILYTNAMYIYDCDISLNI